MNSIQNSARENKIQVVELLLSMESDSYTGNAMENAVENGHFEMIQCLHAHDANCDAQVMDSAAKSGHMDIVQFLHDNRSEGCTTEAMNRAAWKNHLGVPKWQIDLKGARRAQWILLLTMDISK